MMPPSRDPVVHLELHTGDLARACAFYGLVCGWRPERIDTNAGTYWGLGLGGEFGGGVVECETPQPLWLPYIEVADVARTTEQARRLGASVLPSRAKAQRAGEASSARLPPGRSPSGSRRSILAPNSVECPSPVGANRA
jgi:predicted enzyme related to lactoylglutathione lyase